MTDPIEIDQLKQVNYLCLKLLHWINKDDLKENKNHKSRIEQLESLLNEEIDRRKEDNCIIANAMENEVQERRLSSQEIGTIIEKDRETNLNEISSLRDDMMREHEIMM